MTGALVQPNLLHFLENKKVKLTVFYITILILIFSILSGYNNFSSIVLYFGLLLNITYLLLRSIVKKNLIIFLVIFFMSRYIFPLYYPLFTDIQFGAFAYNLVNDYHSSYYKIAIIQLLFISGLSLFLDIRTNDKIKNLNIYNNTFIFTFSIVIFILFTVFGKTGEGLKASSYGSGLGIDSRSTLFEYAVIPFMATAFFSNSKRKIIILHLIALFYILKNTLFGGRIESLMILFILYLFFYLHKLSFKQTLLGLLILVYVMNVVGKFRSNPQLFFDGHYLDLFSIGFFNTSDIQSIVSQESEVNYSSITILKLVEQNILIGFDRIKALILFVLSIFSLSSNMDPISNLSLYARNFNQNIGGGLISVYFYLYGGYIGVFFISFIVSKLLNAFKSRTNNFFSIYSLFLIVTIFRWYAYNPIVMFKLCFYGSIFVGFLILLNKHFNKIRIDV